MKELRDIEFYIVDALKIPESRRNKVIIQDKLNRADEL